MLSVALGNLNRSVFDRLLECFGCLIILSDLVLAQINGDPLFLMQLLILCGFLLQPAEAARDALVAGFGRMEASKL